MRSWAVAAMVAAALAPGLAAAETAKPAKPDLTGALHAILAARDDHFEPLKAGPWRDSDHMWRASLAPPDMHCIVENATDARNDVPYVRVVCNLDDGTIAEAEAKRLMSDIRAAVAALEPGWAWTVESDIGGIGEALYAGPKPGSYLATLSYMHVGDESSVQIEVDDRPFRVGAEPQAADP